MIVVKPGPLGAPAERLLAGLAARGHAVVEGTAALPESEGTVTLAISDGPFVFDFLGLVRSLGERAARVVLAAACVAHGDDRDAHRTRRALRARVLAST